MALFELRAEDSDNLQTELARCIALNHPAVIRVMDVFEHEESLVLVFENVDGVTLQRIMEHLKTSGETLSDRAIFHIGAYVFAALHAAHSAKDAQGRVVPLVHAELAPHQVFVSWSGDVQLLGVGLSTIFRLAAALELQSPAATAFLPPEMFIGGALTVRGNVYSAAAMLWSLLARKQPKAGARLEPFSELRPDLDPEILAALDSTLSPSLLERRMTCGALEELLAVPAGGGAEDLCWAIEKLRPAEPGVSILGMGSLPPPKLSLAPPASMPRLVTIPPTASDEAFTEPPPPPPPKLPKPPPPRPVLPTRPLPPPPPRKK
jgi:serine/threonine protein kinase